MTVTDWRQYKTGPRSPEGSKGFKGSKAAGGTTAAPLEPLGPTLKPSHENRENHPKYNGLYNLEPLKPLKPHSENNKEYPANGPQPFGAMAEAWEERAAIKEFDAGIPRAHAEEEAAREYGLTDKLGELRRQGR